MKTAKRVLLFVLALCMVVASFASCSKQEEKETATAGEKQTAEATLSGEIAIGVSGPLTGGAAFYGQGVKNAAELAVKEINENGGFHGIKFKLVALDDQHDASLVSGNYAEMKKQNVKISLGCVTTGPCKEFVQLSKDELFFITPSASGDDITKNANGYQMCFADSNQGKAAALAVNEQFKGQTIGVFYKSDDVYSKGIFDTFKANLAADVKTVETSFTDATSSDFQTQVDTLKDCKFVFMPIYYDPASLFMKQGANVFSKDTVFYGCDGFDGIDAIEGFDINTIPQEVSMLTHFSSTATEGAAKTFIDKYNATYTDNTLSQFAASAYDCVYAIFQALEKAYATDPESVSADMTSVEFCELLQDTFQDGFVFKNAVTGSGADVSWNENGVVEKSATKFVIKEANN